MRDDNFFKVLFFVAVFMAGGLGYCLSWENASDPDRARNAVESMGFFDVELGAPSPWGSYNGCSEKDTAAFDARATNAAGKRVRLIVCCGGMWKGCTVRTP